MNFSTIKWNRIRRKEPKKIRRTKIGLNHLMIITLILTQLNCVLKKTDLSSEFECQISTSKNVYKLGELPDVKVTIRNKSGKDVYLIKGLDGSEEKMRMPYCYYELKKPIPNSLSPVSRCGNMSPLGTEDFKLVKVDELFNPYREESGYDKAYELTRHENFRDLGKYKIRYYYSTKSNNIEDFTGDGIYGNEAKKVAKLFKLVPSVELVSNTLEIEIQQ